MSRRAWSIRLGLVALLAATGVGAGCQRSSSTDSAGTTTQPPPLTVDEFTTRADRICLAARTRTEETTPAIDEALVPSSLDQGTRDAVVASMTDSLDIDRAAYNGLRALRVPDELASRFDVYLETKRERLIAADDAIAAVAGGVDESYVAAIAALADAEPRAGIQAVELGFVECSRATTRPATPTDPPS